MPCYDPGYRSDDSYNRSSDRELQQSREHARLAKDKADQLEASLCAILRELEKTNNSYIVEQAEINGKVNIKQFKKDHFKEDDTRIDKLLNNLSQHEIDMLKEKLHKYK